MTFIQERRQNAEEMAKHGFLVDSLFSDWAISLSTNEKEMFIAYLIGYTTTRLSDEDRAIIVNDNRI